MRIRIIEKKDLKNACKLYEESFNTITKNVIYQSENIYVLEEDNEIIGLCTIDYINDIFKNKKIAYLNSICVKKEHRNMGKATYMINCIEKICKEEGVNEIMLTSSKKRIEAQHLYKKLNFKEKDTTVFKKEI